MEILLLGALFGFFSGMIAGSRGRSSLGWFLVGFFFGPFGLLVAVLPKIEEEVKS